MTQIRRTDESAKRAEAKINGLELVLDTSTTPYKKRRVPKDYKVHLESYNEANLLLRLKKELALQGVYLTYEEIVNWLVTRAIRDWDSWPCRLRTS